MPRPGIISFDRDIEIDPGYSEALYNKGESYRRRDKYADAIICFEKVIGIDPNYVKAWNSIGLALMAMDRIADAEIAFAKAGKP